MSQSDLKYCGILLPAMPASRNEIIYGYWLLSLDLVKHHGSSYMVLFVPKQDPFCPEPWSVLSWNVVRFVLRRGPFCPEMWSVLSGPFCPWTVLSEYHLLHAIRQEES